MLYDISTKIKYTSTNGENESRKEITFFLLQASTPGTTPLLTQKKHLVDV